MNNLRIIVFLLAAGTIFAGCQDNSTPQPKNTSNTSSGTLEQILPGTWQITDVNQKNGSIKYNGLEVATFHATSSNIVGQMVFTENPDNFTSDIEYTMAVTTYYNGTEQTDESDLEGHNSGTWKVLSNGNLELSDTGQFSVPEVYKIVSKSASKIVMRYDVRREQLLSGITVLTTSEMYMTIER